MIDSKLCPEKLCTGCMACEAVCASGAIGNTQRYGFTYPVVDNEKCVDCGRCTKVCPSLNSVEKHRPLLDRAFAVYAKDKQVRDASSSGGVFYPLALEVVKKGGVVYGASWSKDHSVTHVRVDNCDDLRLLQGSKYVQSNTSGVFGGVLEDLNNGRIVLFSGVPCQIAGLKRYLGKEYPKLYLCEVICHGNASPDVFSRHLEHLERNAKSAIDAISFRFKTDKRCQNIKYRYKNGLVEIIEDPMRDRFFCGFVNGTLLRESCYSCKYVGIARCADISLGDFWGVEKEALALPDAFTYPSLVFINTEHGRDLWGMGTSQLFIKERPLEEAIWGNLSLRRPTPRNKKRDAFFRVFLEEGYEVSSRKYLKQELGVKEIIKIVLGDKLVSILVKVFKR